MPILKKIIKSNAFKNLEKLENIENLKMKEEINNNGYLPEDSYDESDVTNDESTDIESDIDAVMNSMHSDYELNLEEEEEDDVDDGESQNISFIKRHNKNANTIRRNLIIEKRCKRTQRKESRGALQRDNLQKRNSEKKENQKIKSNTKDNLTYPYSQSISSSLSSIPISSKYEKDDNQESISYSVSSFSQSDYYEETDTEYSLMNNNMKIYRHQKAKRYTKNNKSIISKRDDDMEDDDDNDEQEINYLTEENNQEEYSLTKILKYTDDLNETLYNNETFDTEKIENVKHYQDLLSQFLLELLKDKCSEYFFSFHDMIQFQYKLFNSCEQFTSKGQEIFNTYLTPASNLKIDVDTKLVHKIAYGIKYYDRCCFVPLVNIILKILKSKYLKYKIHQSAPIVKDLNYRSDIMQKYCNILDQEYSTNINSIKILTGEESPNQIYKNMLIRKKVYDFCTLIFGKEYFINRKSEGYTFKSKIINFSEKLINPTIK